MFRKGKKRHSSSSSQSSEISTKSKSVDSSLGGLSRSSTVASLDTDSTKSSGQSNSNSDTCAEFRVKYVGAIEKLKHSESKSLGGPLDLINYIDVAQMASYLLFQVKRSSSWGYPNMASKSPPLTSMSLLALKTTDAALEECSLWVYQCSSLEQAQAICKVLSTAFDSVLMSEKS
ncbi:integrin beta-1-binding protein 1 isoform X4 [Melanerpes formicivorus]|uniref:integrin beta-1-binding protein 1 isoform X4 n=1 Tax=Melanerpes formicivorus TaxID=211600 RepID=UPI00358DFCFF